MSQPKTNDEKQLRTYAAGLRDGEKRLVKALRRWFNSEFQLPMGQAGIIMNWLADRETKGKK